MKRLPCIVLAFALSVLSPTAQSQNSNRSGNNAASNKSNSAKRRGPIFRATSEQIKHAQTILKQRNFYAGDETGKLDEVTRAGLKKYQQAEGLKVTGTLNKDTLQKMSIDLTDKQKSM